MLYSVFHINYSYTKICFPIQGAGVAVPDVNFTVSIFNTTDDGDEDFYITSNPLPPQTTSYTFTGVPKGRNYAIELVVTNVIGDNSATMFFGKNTFFLSPITLFC